MHSDGAHAARQINYLHFFTLCCKALLLGLLHVLLLSVQGLTGTPKPSASQRLPLESSSTSISHTDCVPCTGGEHLKVLPVLGSSPLNTLRPKDLIHTLPSKQNASLNGGFQGRHDNSVAISQNPSDLVGDV